jgi:hypothetical protein
MDLVLYYLVLTGAWLGSICYLSGGVKKLSALKHGREGKLPPKTKAMRTIVIGSSLTVLWTVIIIVSIYNQSRLSPSNYRTAIP